MFVDVFFSSISLAEDVTSSACCVTSLAEDMTSSACCVMSLAEGKTSSACCVTSLAEDVTSSACCVMSLAEGVTSSVCCVMHLNAWRTQLTALNILPEAMISPSEPRLSGLFGCGMDSLSPVPNIFRIDELYFID